MGFEPRAPLEVGERECVCCVHKMVVCEVCGRRFRSKRGLGIHVAKAHEGSHRRSLLCKNLAFQFFTFLEESKWAAAERVWKEIDEMELDGDWLGGYTNALFGMMVSLRRRTSHVGPYIEKVREYDNSELQDAERSFKKLIARRMSTEFDKGFFQGWHQYIRFLLSNTKR